MTEKTGMYQNYSVEGEIKLKGDEMMQHQEMGYTGCMRPPIPCPPIYECPQERCVHREIIHEVPQVSPFM